MQRKLSRIKTVRDTVRTAAQEDATKTNWAIYHLKGMQARVKQLHLGKVRKEALNRAFAEAIDECERRNNDRKTAGKKRSARKG